MSSWLEETIGREALKRLSEARGGEYVYVPRLDRSHRIGPRKIAQISIKRAAGLTVAAIARDLGLSTRAVQLYLAAEKNRD